MFVDISKAHLYAPVDDDTEAYVDLPPECSKPGTCGRLNFWLYGMRPASRGWETSTLEGSLAKGFYGEKFHRAASTEQKMTSDVWCTGATASLKEMQHDLER